MTAGHHSRWSASLAVAVAVHGAILALVAGTAIVRLDVVPIRIDLAFLDASSRTHGPGEVAAELTIAAPAAPAAPPPPAPPEPVREPVREQAPPEPPPKESEPVVKLEPERVKKPAPPVEKRPAPPVEKKPAKEKTSKAAPAPPAATSRSPSSGANPDATGNSGASAGAAGDASSVATASGSAARSAAPAWAPAARVRYEQLLFAWMDRHKEYPLLAQRRGLEGSGSVRVRIRRDGRVVDRALVESTGEAMLDQAALDMVRRASPFPAVPAEYGGDTFEFVAPIQYRLR